MEPVGGSIQLMQDGRVTHDGVHQARGSIHPDVAAHPKETLVPLGHLVHFRIPLLGLVLGGAGEAMIVASRIVPSFSITSFSIIIWFIPSRICSAMRCFSS